MLALENRKAGMKPIPHDFIQAQRDLFPCEQDLEELVPEQLHEADRIRARNENKRSIGRNKAVGDPTVKMRMKAGGIISRSDIGRSRELIRPKIAGIDAMIIVSFGS